MTGKHLVFLAALGVTGVFFIEMCNLAFQCGCRSLWAGMATYCNIHAPVAPHCPWCAHPWLGGGIAFAATVAAQWGAVYRTTMTRWWTRLALAVILFPIASGLVALVQRWAWSY